ncbi:hypothetical protein OROHE_023567 [Orobanche hederae]
MIGKIIFFMSRTRPNCKQIGKEIDEQLSEQVVLETMINASKMVSLLGNFCILSSGPIIVGHRGLYSTGSVRDTIIDGTVYTFKDGRNEKQIWWYECALASCHGCVVGGGM